MENIMIASNKLQIKIVDFGLSNIWTPDSPLHTHCGSPEYAAPELFLMGQSYGPEVDLWSLGVILYGMVTGQLPFISTRNEAITSQEKRQRLLSQINRGLTINHRKELSSLSTDFKNLINKLLVPCATARLSTENLLYHPWVTQRQKLSIKVDGLGLIDAYSQSIFINEVADILDISPHTVKYELKNNRYGEICGMYNIKEHLHLIQCKESPGLNTTTTTKITPPTVTPRARTKSVIEINKQIETVSNSKSPKVIPPRLPLSDNNRKRLMDNEEYSTNTSYKNNTVKMKPIKTDYKIIMSEESCAPTMSRLVKTPRTSSNKTPVKTSSNVNSSGIPMKTGSLESKLGSNRSSIPVPINTCPLHTKRNQTIRQTLQRNWIDEINNEDEQNATRIIGTYGLKRPFNQRPATVHTKLKQKMIPLNDVEMQNQRLLSYKSRIKSEPLSVHNTTRKPSGYSSSRQKYSQQSSPRLKNVCASKSTPTSTTVKLRPTTVLKKPRGISGYGDQHSIYKISTCQGEIDHSTPSSNYNAIKKSNPIAKSIAEYIKNFGQESRPIKLLRLKPVAVRNKYQ